MNESEVVVLISSGAASVCGSVDVVLIHEMLTRDDDRLAGQTVRKTRRVILQPATEQTERDSGVLFT